ncbi:MAG TPA: SufE family protein [Thermoanaerobaculia bacterium]|nr:SufE family protein [Thermoanaerobaculia bacterium]
MADLPEKLADLVATLESVEDRNDRIQLLIDLAEGFREVPPSIATRPFPESHRVPGCESEAFVWAEPRPDGTFRYHFAVENPQGISAKALAAILDRTLSGATPEEVARVPPDVIYRLFGRELSMGKSMGLMGMIQRVQGETRRQAGAAAGTPGA